MRPFVSLILVQFDNELVGQILEMDEKLRRSTNDFSFKASTGLTIKSFQYPEINSNAFYLRGAWRHTDGDIFVCRPFTESVTQLYFRLLASLKEFLEKEFEVGISVSFKVGLKGGTIVEFSEYKGYTQIFTKE